ncbi:MAG: molybdopterin-dependent oxidoreductase [Pseudomonadota bacterium]
MSRKRSPAQDEAIVEKTGEDSPAPNRRKFLLSAAAIGAGTAAATTEAVANATRGSWVEDDTPLKRRRGTDGRYSDYFDKRLDRLTDMGKKSQGAKWWEFDTYITPTESFFIRNEAPHVPRARCDSRVHPDHWKLKIEGNAVSRELTLTYNDLLKLPSRTIVATLECAGNARTLFWEQDTYKTGKNTAKKQVGGNSWGLGGIGQAEWTYVPLSVIMDMVGVKKNAKQALFWSGIDKDPKSKGPSYTGRGHPMDDIFARPDDIGLAFKMNGSDLGADHGAPVRMIVPGWCGAASIKWLTKLKFADHNFWAVLNSRKHVFKGPMYAPPTPEPGDEFLYVRPDEIHGPAAAWLKPKSLLTLPIVIEQDYKRPRDYPLKRGELPTVAAGLQTMKGFAWGPEYGIHKVEYRIDGGAWREARIVPPNLGKYTWVRFEFPWEAVRGQHVIETRATDNGGQVQPQTVPYNTGGFDFWAVPRFDVKVV